MLGGAQYTPQVAQKAVSGPARPPMFGDPAAGGSPVSGPARPPMFGDPPAKPVTGVPASPGKISGQSTWQPPKYISADSTQSAVNNRMGQAHMMGDQRIFQKQFARNGLGSSRGTAYAAQIGQQQALGQGRAESAGIQAQDQSNNSKARLDFQNGQEREAQALAMVQHALSQSGWSQDFARQQAMAQILAAQQNAQIQMM